MQLRMLISESTETLNPNHVADLVFEAIYFRTSSLSLVYYTHEQIQKVLKSTLPHKHLHKLMLDQISRQILQKKHNFDSKEAQENLQQVMSQVLIAHRLSSDD